MSGQLIPQDKLDYILEAARLAPSSSGLQQYKLIVISDRALLEKVRTIAYNQSQITECSHLLIWAAWEGYNEDRISERFNEMMDLRGLPRNTTDAYKNTILELYKNAGQDWQAHHAAKQSYISFGLAIAAAAEQKVDATPMEGFLADQLDELLNLRKDGYRSTIILPLGYREEAGDWLVKMKKFRLPKDEFIKEMSLADASDIKSTVSLDLNDFAQK